jgi:hypothetical protein
MRCSAPVRDGHPMLASLEAVVEAAGEIAESGGVAVAVVAAVVVGAGAGGGGEGRVIGVDRVEECARELICPLRWGVAWKPSRLVTVVAAVVLIWVTPMQSRWVRCRGRRAACIARRALCRPVRPPALGRRIRT